MPNTRKYTNKILDLMEEGAFDMKTLCRDLLGYLSEDEVKQFVLANDYQLVMDAVLTDEGSDESISVKITLICDGESNVVDLTEFVEQLDNTFPGGSLSVAVKGSDFKFGTPEVVTLDSTKSAAETTTSIIEDMTQFCDLEEQFGEPGTELFGLAEMALECSDRFDDASAKRLWELFYEHTGNTIKLEMY